MPELTRVQARRVGVDPRSSAQIHEEETGVVQGAVVDGAGQPVVRLHDQSSGQPVVTTPGVPASPVGNRVVVRTDGSVVPAPELPGFAAAHPTARVGVNTRAPVPADLLAAGEHPDRRSATLAPDAQAAAAGTESTEGARTAKEAISQAEAAGTDDELAALMRGEQEREGGPRKTVVEAIERRHQELAGKE